MVSELVQYTGMNWTDDQMQKFQNDPLIGSDSIYADKIMRPMAKEFCPAVLKLFDLENNTGDDPLGPDWHVFAGDLERATIKACKLSHQADLVSYFTFLNWAVNEPISYLSNETILTPLAGFICELPPKAWMKFFPAPNLDAVIQYAKGYFRPETTPPLINEKNELQSDSINHQAHWQPLHKSFSNTAKRLGVPYANLL